MRRGRYRSLSSKRIPSARKTALGLGGTSYTGEQAERAKVANARQVNLQVAEPIDPYLESESRGSKSRSYSALMKRTFALDPIAVEIVARACG